jgi:hypothetical protein
MTNKKKTDYEVKLSIISLLKDKIDNNKLFKKNYNKKSIKKEAKHYNPHYNVY